jgi:superoxide dismutase, Cu-Zn family
MRIQEFEKSDTSCPRTRAETCQCESVNRLTEDSNTVVAQCILEHSDAVKGTILLIQAPGTATLIKGTITGLTPGEHGFHIHEFGDMTDGCKSMGGHYNPDNVDHGDINEGHVGDLGNITADESGTAKFTIEAKRVDLLGERSVIGRGFVVHEDEDDLGKGGDAESLKTGNAGERLACGVIVARSEEMAEVAPPGKEKMVKGLKKKFKKDKSAPYAIAWAAHNKAKKK